jgi:hypothetical protein
MIRSELEDFTRLILLPNSRNATNGPFAAADITNAVQRAYEREWNKSRIQLTRSQVVMSTQFTWPSGAISMNMPLLLRGRIIHSIYDITDNPHGIGMRTVFYIEDVSKKMRWPSTVGTPGTGPFRDTLLRAFFMPQVEVLDQATSEPGLIPVDYHQLLGWSAAIELSEITGGDKSVPATWRNRLEDLQTDYWQACKVPVVADRARILPDDAVDFFYLGAV